MNVPNIALSLYSFESKYLGICVSTVISGLGFCKALILLSKYVANYCKIQIGRMHLLTVFCSSIFVCVFFHLTFMCLNRHFMPSQHFIAWLCIQLLWIRIKLKAWLYYFGFLEANTVYILSK